MKFSNKFTTIEEIESWHQDQYQALTNFKSHQVELALSGNRSLNEKFSELTIDELHSYFDESLEELDYLVSFNLLSAVEAHIRMDFYSKIKDKPRVNITTRYRELYKEKGDMVSLEEDLLRILKEELPDHKSSFSDYIGALKFRHWIAHGRYWVPKFGRNYNTASILPITVATMEAVSELGNAG
ncbi:MAG: hypothetical protein J7497_01855 [Chitinophagaceae bacterium]|nr:hypothetical protein [Chitinophagaceae bacterium]